MSHDHPELPTEQARIDAIYLEAEKKLEHLRTPVTAGINSGADAALRRLRDASARELQQAIEREEGIVFARADFIDEDDPIYLGVQGIDSLSHDQLVVDYRNPFGERYYQATLSQPLGIRRRRTISMQRRTVRSIVDEHLVAPRDTATSALNQVQRSLSGRNAVAAEASPDAVAGRRRRSRRSRSTDSAASDSPELDVRDAGPNDASPSEDGIAEPVPSGVDPEQQQLFDDHDVEVRGRDLLLAELESERTGQMRHVVATIQADQDRLIRADRNQPLLIQGGPGTGKTIVGLHRAAQILYDLRQQRDLTARSSVLIVGPNRRFMDYVARVLPSLGERDVDQMAIDELLLRAATGNHDVRITAGDEGVVSALLGHRRMATLLERAVWSHASPSPLQVKLPSSTIELTVDEVQGIIDELRMSGRSYDDARTGLAQRLVAALVRRYRDRHEARSGTAPMAAEVADVERRLNERISGRRLADRVLPRVTAEDLVVRLREDVGFLRAVAADVLTESSMCAILRRGRRQEGEFTSAELPLLDEAHSIISGGTKRYAHVIVDEAQDISPMQWRAVRRRVSGGAVTLLGDLAQGTRPWSTYSWETVIEALELSGVRYGELRLNYRVPEPIAAYADTILRRIDVVSAPVRHLRTGAPVAWEELADWADSSRSAADRLRRCLDDVEGSVGLIAPSRHHGWLEAALRDANEDLRSRVTLLDPGEAKGLEYDNVILVDPDAVERLPRGERLLYVAATRATKRLFMVTNRREEDPVGDSTDDSRDEVPALSGDALAAVHHRGTHIQIIAAAGSGKTEVVAQRVAHLLAEGVAPQTIVAFTFTERAAEELKSRIARRVEQRLGVGTVDRLAGMYVGTIHAYCFRLLQQFEPRYETYDVLDENRLTAFLTREARRLGIRDLDPQQRLFASVEAFRRNADVVENELMDPSTLSGPFGEAFRRYLETLERYRLLTFGQQIVRAVHELERPELAANVHAQLRHIIVDEYQDVNPAQERLIELLAGPGVEVCVVGDDDQAIYQWRGSDVSNIVTFRERWSPVTTFELATNRRSRPQIVDTANRFARSIPNRLDKEMRPARLSEGSEPNVVLWSEHNELAEAGQITNMILDLHDAGVPYRDIAVLVRGRAAYPKLIEQFSAFGIPVQPGGRSGLFDQPEARVLGRVFCWLADVDWKVAYEPSAPVLESDLIEEIARTFGVSDRRRLRVALRDWKAAAQRADRPADLVGELYSLYDLLQVKSWDLDDPIAANRLGTLARISNLLADYEAVRRRARTDAAAAGEQVGGEDRGVWYYKNLAIHIVHYAQSAYEGFDGEPDVSVDAVDLLTVHAAKGLEWPVVFVPSLTKARFPSNRTGQVQNWLIPRTQFPAERYEGSDADERRLFYVAMTRARDWLSVSRHLKVTTKSVAASPYFEELSDLECPTASVQLPIIEAVDRGQDESLVVSYSDLAAYLACGMAYRLRTLLGFQPRLAPELGYGKAVHHVLRAVAERTRETGKVPSGHEIESILDADFFLPAANRAAHRQMKESARRLITRYAQDHADDLHRVWETERPFELRLEGLSIVGRADVILDREDGVPTALAILDYKASASDVAEHELQLQVYATAARREGLDVRAAYVHDLKEGERHSIPVTPDATDAAITTVVEAGRRLRDRDFAPSPGPSCRRCEVRAVCASAQSA